MGPRAWWRGLQNKVHDRYGGWGGLFDKVVFGKPLNPTRPAQHEGLPHARPPQALWHGEFKRGPDTATPKTVPGKEPGAVAPKTVLVRGQPVEGPETRRFERKEVEMGQKLDELGENARAIIGQQLNQFESVVGDREEDFRRAITEGVMAKLRAKLSGKTIEHQIRGRFSEEQIPFLNGRIDEVIKQLERKHPHLFSNN